MMSDIEYPVYLLMISLGWHWGKYAPLAKKRFVLVPWMDVWFAALLNVSSLNFGFENRTFGSSVGYRWLKACLSSKFEQQRKFWDSSFDTVFRAPGANSLPRKGLQRQSGFLSAPTRCLAISMTNFVISLTWRFLNLADTKVKGELAVLKYNTKLETLDLRATRFQATSMICRMPRIYFTSMCSGTSVSGDLMAVANATRLWYLRVSGTSVSGDLMAVANARKLFYLDASQTSVSGDLRAVGQIT